MPRVYTVTLSDVTVSAQQDLLQIIGASGKTLRVLRAWIGMAGATTLPTAQPIDIRAKLLTATVTNGSGGTSPTPVAMDQGDASASFTAKANSTTQATTNGSTLMQRADAFHLYSGWDVSFARPPVVCSGESWILELLTAPSGTVALSFGVEVEETGG